MTRSKHRWRRRGLALLLGLVPLLLLEATFRLLGWGSVDLGVDPFVGFAGVQPLFVLSDDGRRYEVPPVRQEYFRPESFAARKAPGEFRIFVLGGSTVQGRPYAVETAFSTWLELSLEAADPRTRWQVVNCGGVSYASYRLAPILQEILDRHQPDLILLYAGHNEFLEDRAYAQAGGYGALTARAHRAASSLAVYRAARSWWKGSSPATPRGATLAKEVDTLLDHQGGLEAYRRDDPWRAAVIEHFEFNLRRMLRLCEARGAPVVCCNPVVNLRDCPPFKFAFDPRTPASTLRRLEAEWEAAKSDDLPLEDRIAGLRTLVAADPRHAGLRFHLAKCLEATGAAEARAQFLAAKEEDLCPLRILESMRDVIRRAAADAGAPVVDCEALFASTSPLQAVGDEWMVDHVHPTIEGHQRIAAELLRVLQDEGLVARPADPEQFAAARRVAYRRHLATLDETYYARGKQRLEGLRRWTQGRAHQTLHDAP